MRGPALAGPLLIILSRIGLVSDAIPATVNIATGSSCSAFLLNIGKGDAPVVEIDMLQRKVAVGVARACDRRDDYFFQCNVEVLFLLTASAVNVNYHAF